MSESTTVLVQTETVGATVIVTGATVIGTVPIGPQGPAGPAGATGAQGPAGPAGADGADGQGVPTGGTDGQVLTKTSGVDFATAWEDPTGGGGSGVVETIVAGSNIDVDATDPANPIVSVEALVDADIPATIARDAEVTSAVAAEATARDAAIETHRADTTNVHGIADTSALVVDGDAAGGVLSGTYPNPGFAADMATQAELDAHVNDTADAHDASAISIADAGNDFTATDVEGALAELQADHEAASTALSDHIGDTSDAHDASAISFSPTGTIAATDVQAAIAEVASEAGGGTVDVVSNVATSRILGRTTAGSGDSEELTAAQVKTLLALVAADISDFDTQVAATAVLKSLFDANTILAATSDNTPAALSVGASTFLGRKATGDISAMSVAEAAALLAASFAPFSKARELSYVEFTSPVSSTATVEASADTIVTAAAVSMDGSTSIEVEFYSPGARPDAAAGASLNIWLFDGSSSIGRIAFNQSQAASNANIPVMARRRLTPSNASHTYSVRATVSGGTGSITGGAGGAGNFVPGFIRVATVPHT